MDNRDILENNYKASYDSAVKFVQQNNLPAAKESLKKALENIIKLVECSYGNERNSYMAKATTIAQLLESINKKIDDAKAAANNKPKSAGGGANAKAGVKSDAKDGEEPPKEKIPVEQALAKLGELEGLHEVKKEVNGLVAELQVQQMRKNRGMKDSNTSHHLVFKGNPGTGKTTVARIMADIYYSLGVISKGQLVEVSRTDLVAGYVGQTAIKTQEAIDKAIGGVLFIDEAYTLSKGGNDFGQEAIDTLLKAMEDRRDDLIVIAAGYDGPIEKFIQSNAGLQSRFPTSIHFTDYTGEEMYRIFQGMCKKDQYALSGDVLPILQKYFNDLYTNRGPTFGNARDVRNFFEKVKRKQNMRIARIGGEISNETIVTILPEDLPIS